MDIEKLYLFFQLFNQQSDALNSVIPSFFANTKAFFFYYDTIYRYFFGFFHHKPVAYSLIYLFVVPTTHFEPMSKQCFVGHLTL